MEQGSATFTLTCFEVLMQFDEIRDSWLSCYTLLLEISMRNFWMRFTVLISGLSDIPSPNILASVESLKRKEKQNKQKVTRERGPVLYLSDHIVFSSTCKGDFCHGLICGPRAYSFTLNSTAVFLHLHVFRWQMVGNFHGMPL